MINTCVLPTGADEHIIFLLYFITVPKIQTWELYYQLLFIYYFDYFSKCKTQNPVSQIHLIQIGTAFPAGCNNIMI